MRDVIRHQQELNDLCRRNTQQAQARQRKRFDKKAAGAKAYSVGDYVWVFQNVIPPKGTKKLLKKWRGPFMITKVHQEGRFYRLSTGRAARYENIKPHNPSTEDWCIPTDMEEGDYLKGYADKGDYLKGYRFIKGYADKVYPMQKLMRNKGKKFKWSDEAQTAFQNIKR